MNFEIKKINRSVHFDHSQDMYPSVCFTHDNQKTVLEDVSSTYFGYVFRGQLEILTAQQNKLNVYPGMYFSIIGKATLSGSAEAVLFQRKGFRGLNMIGGPLEELGRLTYIDGCTSSLIISPPRRGDACLNYLHFPANTKQSCHIHPTLRLGVVTAGEGFCVQKDNSKKSLKMGDVFSIPAGMYHSFNAGKNGLSVVAFHPDSDWGPTDQEHPMLNRTYLK